MTIGIIDTGVEKTHRRLKTCDLDGVQIYLNESGNFDELDDFTDVDGHGTGIASIIHKHIPTAKIFNVKLSSYNGQITEGLLCKAIAFLLNNSHAKIINISLGVHTYNPSKELFDLCQQAYSDERIIVASAYYQAEKICYPAYYKCVYGVGLGLLSDGSNFKYIKDHPTNILAKGSFQRVATIGDTFKFGSGTSLATAHFTGILARTFLNGTINSIKDIEAWLIANSDNTAISLSKHENLNSNNILGEDDSKVIENLINSFKLQSVKSIAVFPSNEKEIKSIVFGAHLMPYTITLAINYPRPLKYDNSITEKLKELKILEVNRIMHVDFDSFDTLIVGYILDELLDYNLTFSYQLLLEVIKRNKNIIIWDDSVYKLIQQLLLNFPEYSGQIYFPKITSALMKSLYKISPMPKLRTPVIGIFGTGSKQGKFTTQLVLKEILELADYTISLISSEPQGILFNSDLIFPFGHNPAVEVNTGEWPRIIQTFMQGIERIVKPEIFIASSQGGSIPLHPIRYEYRGGLKQLSFLLGVQPDAIVFTINPHDDEEFIVKSINMIKTYINCEVLFFCMTPWTHQKQKWVKLNTIDYNQKIKSFQQKLKTPVFNILEAENQLQIINIIQTYFSKNNL